VLSANLVTDGTSYNMKEYIKPYIIKNIGGKKVGIFGLTTFQMVFDQFLEPYNVTPPLKAGKQTAQYLKNVEKCDVIIALSHMGIEADQYLAYAAPEISLIVGGHTHLLLKKPEIINGVPIVHIGQWGFYLGQYVLHIDDAGKVSLKTHKVNQIDSTIPENLDVKVMVEGFQKVIEEKMGPVFTDKALYSDVDLPLGENQLEYTMGNWAVDGLRAATDADMGIDNAHYRTKQIYRGWTHTGDFFELFPHTYSAEKNRAWDVYTFEVNGSLLRLMMSAIFLAKGNGSLISNANLVIDFNSMLQPLNDFKIGGKDVSSFKTYKVATTEGIIEALKFIKNIGLDLKFTNIQDKGIEAWRAIQNHVVTMSPVSREKAKWEGRIRSLQPDLMVVPESIDYQMSGTNEMTITFEVLNAGMQPANLSGITVKVDATPQSALDENWQMLPVAVEPRILQGGESYWASVRWSTTGKVAGPYALHISAAAAEGEMYLPNNEQDSTVALQEYSPYGLEGSFFKLPLPDLSPWKKEPKVSFGVKPSMLKKISE
jgi:2',3'-cyclic-nucleotide 2'-phosphodiesterase (5'-nucleotidase family)